jgi:hypothetical protein
MSGVSCRNYGEVIVFRGVSQSKIWYALPVFVVQDTPTLIALYWPAGTRGKWRMKPSSERVTPQGVILTPMEVIDRAWDTTDVLMLIFPRRSPCSLRDVGNRPEKPSLLVHQPSRPDSQNARRFRYL